MKRLGVEEIAKAQWPWGGGEMAARIAAFDWSATPLGPLDEWPQSLRTVVDLMLGSAQPACIGWGEHAPALYNDAYIPILGAKHPQALGSSYSAVFAEIWDDCQPMLRAVLDGQAQVFRDRPLPLGGREGLPLSWFSFSLNPLRDEDGRVRGIYCTVFETTERVQATVALQEHHQAALSATEARYHDLFEAIDEGFCIIEMQFDEAGRPRDYRFLETNPVFERHTGLHDAVGRTARELVPGLEPHWFERYGRVARTGESARFEEYAQDMGERWFDVFAFPTGEPGGNQVAVLFTDVSARHRAEAALRAADRQKDEFLATLAHELRNPLAPLRNGLHIARFRSADQGPLRKTIDMMDRQLTHMVRLIDDLLDVARISSGKIVLRRERLRLGEVMASAVESTRGLLRRHDHALHIEQEQPLEVDGDFERLSQVFTNLLSNAAKYTEPGGRIRVTLSREGEHAVVRVSDSGIGIPPEQVGRVFDLFSQVREHQARADGGLGIGLALVRRLVALHGGEVDVASEGRNQGSTFTVRLPMVAAQVEATMARCPVQPLQALGARLPAM